MLPRALHTHEFTTRSSTSDVQPLLTVSIAATLGREDEGRLSFS